MSMTIDQQHSLFKSISINSVSPRCFSPNALHLKYFFSNSDCLKLFVFSRLRPLSTTYNILPTSSHLIQSTQCYSPSLQSRIMLKKAMYCRFSTCPSAMLQLIRNAHTKLFVGGLSFDSNENVLRDAFSKHGDIIEVRVICDHVTGKSKGYGFVKFASEDSAASALKEMNDQVLDGRSIRVYHAHKK